MNFKKTFVVIPTLNEKKNIGQLVQQIFSLYPDLNILIVDDNSTDGSLVLIKQLQRKCANLHLLVRTKNKGRGAACVAGFQYILSNFAQTKYVIEMDADFSHDPKEIPKLLAAGAPQTVVVGSRYVRGSKIVAWPLWRIVLSKLANFYARLVLQIPIHDYTDGFRCYSTSDLKKLNLSQIKHPGFITLSEIAYLLQKRGVKFREIPITFTDRTQGKSHATLKELLSSLKAIIEIRLNEI